MRPERRHEITRLEAFSDALGFGVMFIMFALLYARADAALV